MLAYRSRILLFVFVLVVLANGLPIASFTVDTASAATITSTSKGVTWPKGRWWDSAQNAYNWAGIESDLDDMQRANITWVKVTFVPDTAASVNDRLLPMMRARGLDILGHIMSPEPYYLSTSSTYKSEYRAWLAETVRAYKGSVQYWEIHNEPNLSYFWRIDHNNPDATAYANGVRDYLAFLRDCYQTIKANDPNAKVLHGGLSSWTDERYIAELIKQNGQQYFDIMGFHPYPDWSKPNPEGVADEVVELRAEMAKQAALASKPIWVTEIGFNSSGQWPAAAADEQQKADFLVGIMNNLRQAGISAPIFWYTFIADPTDPKMTGYDLIRKDSATLQATYLPAYYAYRDLWPGTPWVAPPVIPASARTVTLNPTADTFVTSSSSGTNYGGATVLRVHQSPETITYMRFDLRSLAGQTLDTLKLRIRTAGNSNSGSSAQQFVRTCDTNWSESAVTYSSRPTVSRYTVGGGIQYTVPNTWYEMNLYVPDLQSRMGQFLCLALINVGGNDFELRSRETPERPQLTITYHDENNTYASDSFTRTVNNNWGSATKGGNYSLAGTSADYDVNSWAGTILLSQANANRAAYLNSVSTRDVDATFRVRTSKLAVGGSAIGYFLARRVNSNSEYRGRVRFATNGEVFVAAERVVNGTVTMIGTERTVSGVTHAANGFVWMRVRVQGANPTNISIKAWRFGSSEPTDWQYTNTDSSSSLQTSGTLGMRAYLSAAATNAPMLVTFDNFQVTTTAPPAAATTQMADEATTDEATTDEAAAKEATAEAQVAPARVATIFAPLVSRNVGNPSPDAPIASGNEEMAPGTDPDPATEPVGDTNPADALDPTAAIDPLSEMDRPQEADPAIAFVLPEEDTRYLEMTAPPDSGA